MLERGVAAHVKIAMCNEDPRKEVGRHIDRFRQKSHPQQTLVGLIIYLSASMKRVIAVAFVARHDSYLRP